MPWHGGIFFYKTIAKSSIFYILSFARLLFLSEESMKIGLIDLGGGMRGTYATGILEYCTKNNIKFDCCIGISAGSSNLINFLSNQQERNYRYYFDYAFRKENVGLQSLFKTGSFFYYKNIYEVYPKSDNIDPIDYDTLMNNPADFSLLQKNVLLVKLNILQRKI